MISWRFFIVFGRASIQVAIPGARSGHGLVSAELEQNCAYDGAYAALEEQRPVVVRSSRIVTHAGDLRWSQVQSLEQRGCRSKHGRRGRLEDCQEHCRGISRSVQTVQGRIDALRVRRAQRLQAFPPDIVRGPNDVNHQKLSRARTARLSSQLVGHEPSQRPSSELRGSPAPAHLARWRRRLQT